MFARKITAVPLNRKGMRSHALSPNVHQSFINSAVIRFAFRSLVACDRFRIAEAFRAKTGGINPHRNELRLHGIGALLRERPVRCSLSGIIRMAVDLKFYIRIFLQILRDIIQGSHAFRTEGGFADIERNTMRDELTIG